MLRLSGLVLLVAAVALSTVVGPGWGAPIQREANTTLRLPEVPGSFGYRLTAAFPGESFRAVAIVPIPGETNRLMFANLGGEITVIPDLQNPIQELFLNLKGVTVSGGEQGLLGMAFHPRYADNGRFFVFRTVIASTPGRPNQLHDRLSEFRVLASDPNRGDPDSEVILFQQPDPSSNHNGGDLHFGPDGYLYVSLGDGGGFNDQYGNSQRIDGGFFAGLLRIDVDNRPGSLPPNPNAAVVGNYRIPPDNPFVGVTRFNGRAVRPEAVRTEFFAVGLRNPWRFSIDSANGDLWIGDVGQNRWESVFKTRKGANHGWAFLEGGSAGPKSGMPADFRTNPEYNYVAPVFSYSRGTGPTQGSSLIGGFVYRGVRLPSLHGAYLFADYVSGNLWALRRPGTGAVSVERLLGRSGIIALGTDPSTGDVLLSDLAAATVWRLGYDATFTGPPIPGKLSETGVFSDPARLTPAPGWVPYEVNHPFWSDGARKRRWFTVPNPAGTLGFSPQETWSAPNGTVWMKHFDIEITNGVPESIRRLETRFLVRNSNGVHGVTYRWTSPTEAELVPETGADEVLNRVVNGVRVAQTWHYPGRAECLSCHNAAAGFSLGFNTAQWNRDVLYPGGTRTNQIGALAAAGYFTGAPPTLAGLPTLAVVDDESVSVEWRARSYLEANCSFCHRPGGPGGGFFDARRQTPTALAGIIDGRLNDVFGDPGNRVLVPGDWSRSLLAHRMSTRGAERMPPLASNRVDEEGSLLMARWIDELAKPPPVPRFRLQGGVVGNHLSLRMTQPANHAVQLEGSPSLYSPNWSPLPAPGTGPYYPAEARELWMEVPVDGGLHYFRARVSPP
ncbi:MAG: PQQ-dependent sugar dehydrogenase [Verrucomicrobiales bacterium]|nr:PQQ-dependent sugar dehydrogenase [Verrucomicrobiales bacterium]